MVGIFRHEEITMDIELLVYEIKKVKLIDGKSIDLSLNECGRINFTFHNIKFLSFKIFYIIEYSFIL